MKTYKNTEAENSDCTNIVFAQGEKPQGKNWIESSETELKNSSCKKLYKQANTNYYGWL